MEMKMEMKQKRCTERKAETEEEARSRRWRERSKAAAMVDRRIERSKANEKEGFSLGLFGYKIGFRVLGVTSAVMKMCGGNVM